MRPRPSRAQIVAGLLCALLGFAAATQVRQVERADFSELRQDELIEVLDRLNSEAELLEEQNATLEGERDRLQANRNDDEAAQQAARARAEVQGILAGTLPVEGPGITLTWRDPEGQLTAPMAYLLVDELRNAGAEAISVGDVRITASSYFADDGSGHLIADGQALASPCEWRAIGDPATLQTALGIPGGVLATLRTLGGSSDVTVHESLAIDAVKRLEPLEHAAAIE
jgi:uncharacterized protein YlxW (UPF0749 family)